jgi:xylan 1,4-beta-xylosidase
MACQDMSGALGTADFDWFEYVERPYRRDPFRE